MFTIRMSHEMSTKVLAQLEEIYDISVHPLVDALSGRVEVLIEEEDGEDEDMDESEEEEEEEEEKADKEAEKDKPEKTVTEADHSIGFESLVEAANVEASKKDTGDDELFCITLFPYKVPEDKTDEKYQNLLQERKKELDGLCRSGASFKRNVSVWNGDKDLEEKDAEWAKIKLELLKEEKKALKEEDIKKAKRFNLSYKLHEQKRLVPKKYKRKAASTTGESPSLKKQSTKQPSTVADHPSASSQK